MVNELMGSYLFAISDNTELCGFVYAPSEIIPITTFVGQSCPRLSEVSAEC